MLLTKRHYLTLTGAVVLAVALGVGAASPADHSDALTLPEHTAIHVTLDQSVSSRQNRPGDTFAATVSHDVVVDGKTVIPQGSPVQGVVVEAKRSGRLMGRAQLELRLRDVQVDNQTYDLRTSVQHRIGKGHKKRNWLWIGGGAGGGAAIGALAAGGTGALIGGPIGAGVGTTVAFVTGHRDIKLRPETPLTFRLAEPVSIPPAKG